MPKPRKNYFFYTFITLLLSVFIFKGFKQVLPERLFPEVNVNAANQVVDSLAILAMAEFENDSLSIDNNNDTIKNNTPVISKPRKPVSSLSGDSIPASENMEGYAYLSDFYEKLYTLQTEKNGKVRIAYYSDSMTDGDLIVQDFRKKFQDEYGGEGVGFVGITSLSAASRYSVTHKYSKNWKTYTFMKKSESIYPGIDGQVSFAEAGNKPNIEYRANDLLHAKQLYRPVLYYGQSENQDAYIKIFADKDSVVEKKLQPVAQLNKLVLTDTNPKKIKVEFYNASGIPFYGINSDSKDGVQIDNFSMRGNTGLPLATLNTSLMNLFDLDFHYDLVILHYGTNILSYGSENYYWYEKKMTEVVNHLRECYPQTDILIISTADKSTKYDDEMRTDDMVFSLVKSQRKYAEENHSAFINLFELMGGEDSMVKWVEEEPILANKDYTHFNASGSRKVGNLLYDEIMKGYKKYKEIKNGE